MVTEPVPVKLIVPAVNDGDVYLDGKTKHWNSPPRIVNVLPGVSPSTL